MPKLPVLSGKKLIAILKKNGYVVLRQKGSHVFIEHPQKNTTTIIPVHKNEDLGKGIIRSILNDLEITVEELIQMIS